MVENGKIYWTDIWTINTCNLFKDYLDRDGNIGYDKSKLIISCLIELNESIDLLIEMREKVINIDYVGDICETYELVKILFFNRWLLATRL